MTTIQRVLNFSAGPVVLPVPVLEEIQRDLLALPGVGMSVLEISHRSKTFDKIFNEAESGLRELMGIPDNYHVLFLQGGASLQFSMVPINFLPADASADYIITGSWGKKALKEAKRAGGTIPPKTCRTPSLRIGRRARVANWSRGWPALLRGPAASPHPVGPSTPRR